MKADGTYTYTRDDGSAGGVEDKFQYTLTDKDGDTSQATLTINVGDDRPTINVPTDAGHTTVNEKGLPAGSGELSDGDATNNSDKSETVNGTISYTEGDAPAAITIQDKNGNLVNVANGIDIAGADGTLHINSVGGGKIDYTYTLTTNTSGDATHDDFKVVVKDSDGDAANGTLVINIVDDVPTAKDDSVSLKSGQSTYSSGINVETNDVFGADGKAAGGVVGVHAGSDDKNGTTGVGTDIHGQFGTLHVNADGTFSYTRDNNDPITGTATDKFTYTIKDGDGDLDSAVLTINLTDNPVVVTPPDPPKTGDNPIDLNKDGTAVYEAALPTGSNPGATTESTTGSL